MIPNPRWADARRMLCIRLDAMGDVLMTTPALRALAESGSSRRLTLLTSPAGAAIAPLIPNIDDLLIYDAPWVKATPPRTSPARDRLMIERLSRQRFDAAVIFTVYSQNPLPAAQMAYLAGIPLRLAHCRENPYQLLTDWVRDPEPHDAVRHEVRRQMDLVAAVGCKANDDRLGIRVPPQAAERVGKVLARLGLDDGERWLVMHTGASAPSRRYPLEQFAAAAEMLARRHHVRIVLTGHGETEIAHAEIIRRVARPRAFSLAGRLSLAELAALLQRTPCLVSNNTGPVHIACAVGTPVVDLYALTNPQHVPWGVASRVLSHEVPCRNCYKSVCPEGHHDCLRLVPPEAVVRAALELLGEPPAKFVLGRMELELTAENSG